MPFPFTLPTTSTFSFSSCFTCDSHPSLPLNASTYRGVVRDALKKHKRLPPTSRISNLSTLVSVLEGYLPYLLAIDSGVSNRRLQGGEIINVVLKAAPSLSWRPTLSGDVVPGRERARVKIASLEHEIFFVLSTLGFVKVLTSRACLQPLYTTTGEVVSAQERTTAITSATKYLLEAASIYDYIATRSEQISTSPPCADVAPTTLRALACLAHAEATILAVLKDDPYPAAVAQDRNKNDTDWMFKSPDIPKVRAHLYARLSLAASEHAAKAASLLQSVGSGTNKVNPGLLRYIEDMRRTSRARACRFFGIDSELGGETAEGIGWVSGGLKELGMEPKEGKKGLSLSRLKKDLTERREDRRVEKETSWGADGGRLEEIRVLEMLEAKWTHINDTINTRPVPPINSLLSKMPSGREIHNIKPYQPPILDRDVLEAMRTPPEGDDDLGQELSSDDELRGSTVTPGAFPGGGGDYSRISTPGNAYY